jgi:hypothetical protein
LLVLQWSRRAMNTYVLQDEAATFRDRTGNPSSSCRCLAAAPHLTRSIAQVGRAGAGRRLLAWCAASTWKLRIEPDAA